MHTQQLQNSVNEHVTSIIAHGMYGQLLTKQTYSTHIKVIFHLVFLNIPKHVGCCLSSLASIHLNLGMVM